MRNKIALIALAIVIGFAVWGNIFPNAATNNATTNTVTLRAAPVNDWVQMFDDLRDGSDVKVTTFPDGMKCSKVSDLLRYDDGGPPMFFYKLNCNGTVGYVNADWVR